MNLPKVLRIVGKNYRVVQTETPMIDDCGQCDDNKQEIKISQGMAHDLERDTLLHEAIHAIDYCMQLNMSEKQVNGMGTALYALLGDNPDLIKYLIAKPKKTTVSTRTAIAAKKRTIKRKSK